MIKKMAPKVDIKLHFCTIRAKDFYQLKNRYLRRAEIIRHPHEEVTPDGLLLYGQLEGRINDLERFKRFLMEDVGVPEKFLSLEGQILKIPYYLLVEEECIRASSDFHLQGHVVEMIPFRDDYAQITEKTPVKVFRREHEWDEG